MATLKDISEKTGLSIGTISRVLNYDQTLYISDEKKHLILKTADELNYKTLQERKMNEGKILILQTSSKSYELQDPYFMSLKAGAENYAQNNKINFDSNYLDNIELTDIKDYLGVVIIGLLSNEKVKLVKEYNNNIIFVENNPMTGSHNSVNVDLTKIARDVADYFSINSRNLVYFGPLSNEFAYDIRQEAFKSAAAYHGLEHDQIATPMDLIAAYTKALEYLSTIGTKNLSIFCANDNVAMGVLRATTELKLEIPGQVEIIGINNIPATEFLEPPLSTVNIPSEFMGEYAVKILVDNIEHDIQIPINHVVSASILHRGTTIGLN
ncbi:LacI family DNA-binding transcriptional regulator [Mollicutes bacterium LVI A0039]|nr:LacI family DNA-binding transcriptional regulator [Mollicutes bacterium LVI A0039]